MKKLLFEQSSDQFGLDPERGSQRSRSMGISHYFTCLIGTMNRLLIAVILLALCSCKEISFKEPQPRGKAALTAVPEALRGYYLPVREDGDLSKDTVVILSNGYRFGYFNTADRAGNRIVKYDARILGDSLVVKLFKNYFFISFREDPEWLLRVIRQERNGDIVYMAPGQKGIDFKDYIKKLSTEVKIDSAVVNRKTIYQIDPSPQTLLKLVESGYFSRTILRKVK